MIREKLDEIIGVIYKLIDRYKDIDTVLESLPIDIKIGYDRYIVSADTMGGEDFIVFSGCSGSPIMAILEELFIAQFTYYSR